MKKNLPSFILFAALVWTIAACQPTPTTAPTTLPQSAPTAMVEPLIAPTQPAAVVLTVAGSDGTKTFRLEDLKNLPAAEGLAGYKTSTGKIYPPQKMKGVLLTDLLDQTGGLDASMGVQVEASDGYAMTFSYDQVTKGNFVTYDPATGDEIANPGNLRVALAYEMEGKPLDPQTDGNLRLVVLGDQPTQVVDGHWSVKFINKVTIKPMAADWSLVLQGKIIDEVDRGTFESCSTGQCHPASWTDEKAVKWNGTPLYLLAGRVDDENKHGTGAFDAALAAAGYTIEIVGKDGYSVTLDSKRVRGNKNILVANTADGNPLTDKDFPLKLVGSDVSPKESVGGIEKIILHLDVSPAPEATATVCPTEAAAATSNAVAALSLSGLVDRPLSWSLPELKKLDVVKATVEHPKSGKMDVEGVRLNELLDLAGFKPEAKIVSMIASDGYVSDVDLAAVRACKDCLIYFTDKGGLNAAMPGMQSNFWARDVEKIELK
ncbi:MAG TPA: hypothetical protein VMT46_10525 [Anaerolineaceae bacterium]|nr:hypothetical protein [Anaerolineaceae bacterium]